MATLDVVVGDITLEATDAIVNAANRSLLGGGGVDGAIHRAAGPELLEACRALGGCPTGEARLTPGFRLRSRFVIHAVGPVWRGGVAGEEDLLEGCYRQAILLAGAHRLRSVAFPCISTGAYGYPVERAAPVAVRAVRATLPLSPSVGLVRFVCFNRGDAEVYEAVLGGRKAESEKS